MNNSAVLSAVLLTVSLFAGCMKKDQPAVRPVDLSVATASAHPGAPAAPATEEPTESTSYWAAWAEAAAH